MKKSALIVLAAVVALVGCNNGDDNTQQQSSPSTPTKQVKVTASLGKISNAAIKASCSSNNSTLGIANIDTNSTANLTLAGACTSPVVFELVASTTSQYYDEATGSNLALPVGTRLRVAVPSLQALTDRVGMTALTEIAVQRALTLNTTLNATNVTAANQAISDAFFDANIDIDLLSTPTVWSSTTTQLDNTAADIYAFYLAALAKLAGSDATPALTALSLLAQDLKDGQIDQAEGIYANAEQLRAAQKTAMQQLAAFANADLKAKLQLTTDPVDPETPSCGDQATLTLVDLASYTGAYDVKIIDSTAATDNNGMPIPVKTTTLSLATDGKITLDGQTANTIKVCTNRNTLTGNTGAIAYLDKNDALGRAHVDFWQDRTVNGTDFTSPTVFRYFNGTKQTSTPVDPTPNTACTGNTNPFGCLQITGLTQTQKFEHLSSSIAAPQVIRNPIADAGTVTWATNNGQILNSSITNLTYTYSNVGQNFRSLRFGFVRYDSKGVAEEIYMDCGSNFAPACTGLTVDMTSKTLTLNQTQLTAFTPPNTLNSLTATFSGTLKF